ncbi:unnamed protein product [Parnassius apollo]|uniref:(apollo) hypothetical protein n=1 Tax=Parnassius apollo TaxID=110799 RepID=A0A8S3X5U7_PARAO|nr:unnamed protein product [Parnassius apollo]
MRDEEGCLKPIVLISSDGGPDENPRYPKVISHAIHHFVKHDLDAIFIFTNAPGRSAFNRVERRMAPLSRELSGLIFPHDFYGSHLDEQGRTKDHDLEKMNFQKAGKVLAEVWDNMVIDGHDVVAEYVEPDDSSESFIPDLPSPQWYSEHVRESQYLLQVVKCDDRACCGHMRSSLRSILSERFVIPPYPILQSSSGLCILKPQEHDGKTFATFLLRRSLGITPTHEGFKKLPYDLYCPSLQKDRQQLLERTCQRCGLYFCTKKKVKEHPIDEKLACHTENQKNSINKQSCRDCDLGNISNDRRNIHFDNCTDLVAVHGRPFALIEDEAFQKLLNLIPGMSGTPINSTNIKRIKLSIEEKAHMLRKNICDEVKNKLIALKVDVSSLKSRQFLGLNIQYIREGKIVLRNVGIMELHQRNTAEFLKDCVTFMLSRFGIEIKQLNSITTDNGANMLSMVKKIDERIREAPEIFESLEDETDVDDTDYYQNLIDNLQFDLVSSEIIPSHCSSMCGTHAATCRSRCLK